MGPIKITIKGPRGAGKTALMHELGAFLVARGLNVQVNDNAGRWPQTVFVPLNTGDPVYMSPPAADLGLPEKPERRLVLMRTKLTK